MHCRTVILRRTRSRNAQRIGAESVGAASVVLGWLVKHKHPRYGRSARMADVAPMKIRLAAYLGCSFLTGLASITMLWNGVASL